MSGCRKTALTAVCGASGCHGATACMCCAVYYLLSHWRNTKLLSQTLTELWQVNPANQKATKITASKISGSSVGKIVKKTSSNEHSNCWQIFFTPVA